MTSDDSPILAGLLVVCCVLAGYLGSVAGRALERREHRRARARHDEAARRQREADAVIERMLLRRRERNDVLFVCGDELLHAKPVGEAWVVVKGGEC